ncbi:Formamidase [Pseudomonas syringae pv. maculicola]|nr:Formamidase [Pseudomonas syringae pv. maculicola]RMV84069.1 Formamidase amiF [Pseudomonas amygdali pv. tabaci]
MHDLTAGQYRLPWENDVVHTDGSSCGFAAPERDFKPTPSSWEE